MRLLLATTNSHKLREIRGLLADAGVDIVALTETETAAAPEETGATFADNARIKALAYSAQSADLTVAEDSGLVIDALDGEPGVRSARFVREDASYPERFAEISRRLAAVPDRPRTARFVCAVAVAEKGRIVYESTGAVEGTIAPEPRGTAGFGYDPIFFYPPYGCTFGEVSEPQKLAVAHRGTAFRALGLWLRDLRASAS